MVSARSIIIRVKCKLLKITNWKSKVREVKKKFTLEDAIKIAKALKIDFSKEKFDLQQFLMGINVELEHGAHDPQTNVTSDNPIITGKIALAHLKEIPNYYTLLAKLEEEAKISSRKQNQILKKVK